MRQHRQQQRKEREFLKKYPGILGMVHVLAGTWTLYLGGTVLVQVLYGTRYTGLYTPSTRVVCIPGTGTVHVHATCYMYYTQVSSSYTVHTTVHSVHVRGFFDIFFTTYTY